ncbi:MAG: helix-turn-helix domain-containing protein [Proteobacteria bacterium]|nr:helix-turn-helix domain-containing protein [Pseudomonadota bacterium]
MAESGTLERAYRLRAHPTRAQQRAIGRLIGAARFVWNWALWSVRARQSSRRCARSEAGRPAARV